MEAQVISEKATQDRMETLAWSKVEKGRERSFKNILLFVLITFF